MSNSNPSSKDVLEQNVSDLIESGGEAPRIADAARARIRDGLVAKFAVAPAPVVPKGVTSRRPLFAIGLGFAATAAIALVATHAIHHGGDVAAIGDGTQKLADGTTYIARPGTEVTVLGPRKLRIKGIALLDVAPGKGVFVVETERGRIEVLGTRFVVDGAQDRTTAAVVRGEVKLASADGEVVLHAGEQAVAEPGRPPVRGPAPRLSHLVSWAQQARHAEEHEVTASHHGTLFARDPGVRSHPPWGQEYPLPIEKLGLDITVEDQVMRVALDQTFHNNANQDLEGMYRFAIPPDAALQRLAMYVDGKLTESAVVERMRARRIYEELVYRRVDPALLEWAGVGRLALRVYPLKAQEDKRLMLAYTQSLPKLYDDYTITVPLPDVDQAVGAMDVSVRLKGCANCEVQSTSHTVTTERSGEDAIVSYHHEQEKLGDSFVLHVRDTRHRAIVATASDAGENFLLVRSPVTLGVKAPAYKPRTWMILDDVSASRDPAELHAQRDLIEAMVGELDENDKVGVIAFDVQARQKLAVTRVMDVDRKALRKSLQTEGGVGATDFEVALAEATKQLAGVDPDSAMIVYLGDGLITSGTRHLDELRAELAGKAHFVGIGVGDGPDTQTLGALAAATGGYTTTMDLADDLAWRAFDVVAALHTSRVTGLEAKLVDATGALVPATAYLNAPQLADGEELELVAKLASDHRATAVELTGTLDGAPWQQRITLESANNKAGYLPRMWAQRHIAARLLAKQEPVAATPCVQTHTACPSEAETREARDEQIRREVVGLGKKYFLLSRHTSLLVLENDDMYRQYDVQKGTGETWAPYVMPSTIPVVRTAQPVVHVSLDAEVARAPLQIFQTYDYSYGWGGRGGLGVGGGGKGADLRSLDDNLGGDEIFKTGGLAEGQIRAIDGPIATATPMSIVTMPTGATMHERNKDAQRPDDSKYVIAGDDSDGLYGGLDTGIANGEFAGGFGFGRMSIDTKSIGHGSGTGNGYFYRRAQAYGGSPMPQLVHLNYASDATFDDLTGFIPALAIDSADSLRRSLGEPATHTISDSARALLADSRAHLPSGVYRWGDREIAVDDAHRLGWRRTTGDGLVETASYDGATWTRRYAELGLDVVRPVATDDITLGLAYLPVWIADPAHYAQYFDVTASGRVVTLSSVRNGKTVPMYLLTFDDKSRLVAIADGAGHRIVEIAWGTQGPMAAKVNGEAVSVGFAAQTIGDAAAWSHQNALPGVVAEQPAHPAAYWQKAASTEQVGSVGWRRAQRQLLVSAAAQHDIQLSFATFEALRLYGGVELGDLVLASGGVIDAASDAQVQKIMESFPRQSVVQYVLAGRAYRAHPEHPQPMATSREGLVGALSQLRLATAQLTARDANGAAATVATMTAPDLKFAAAAAGTNLWDLPVEPLLRMWDANAVGPMKNVARAQAAMLLINRSKIDLATERTLALVDDLDLDAVPPDLSQLHSYISMGRQGQVGLDLFYAKLRAKVIGSSSYAHVVAMLPIAQQHQDAVQVLSRAAELAGDDVGKQVDLARTAMAYGQSAWVQGRIKQLVATSPTRDVYQLAAQVALARGDLGEGLTDLEAAQDKNGDEQVPIATMRAEMAQILSVAQQLATQATGAARDAAVKRAMVWGDKWRAVDAGNTQIDVSLGELLLATGDEDGAWRQLSSVIERDPWSGTGYMTVAGAFERRGKVADALPYWQQAIVIDQTNPTPILRKAQAELALGNAKEADVLLKQITQQKWHDVWSNVVYQAQALQQRTR